MPFRMHKTPFKVRKLTSHVRKSLGTSKIYRADPGRKARGHSSFRKGSTTDAHQQNRIFLFRNFNQPYRRIRQK